MKRSRLAATLRPMAVAEWGWGGCSPSVGVEDAEEDPEAVLDVLGVLDNGRADFVGDWWKDPAGMVFALDDGLRGERRVRRVTETFSVL